MRRRARRWRWWARQARKIDAGKSAGALLRIERRANLHRRKTIREYDLRTLREAIGVVTQESFLFNGPIRENLLMGKPDATDAELWLAIDAANARQFIERLPEDCRASSANAA